MKSKRNTNAGNHPSYEKLNMSAERIKKKREYDAEYSATPERKKYRAELNAANKKRGTYGNGDGMDMSHTKKGTLVKDIQSKNRARNGQNKKSTKK